MPVPHGEEHFRGRVGRPPDLPDPPDPPNLSDLSDLSGTADYVTNHDRKSRHLARSRLGLTEREGVSNKRQGCSVLGPVFLVLGPFLVRRTAFVRSPWSADQGPKTL